jgi:hypothetical protein
MIEFVAAPVAHDHRRVTARFHGEFGEQPLKHQRHQPLVGRWPQRSTLLRGGDIHSAVTPLQDACEMEAKVAVPTTRPSVRRDEVLALEFPLVRIARAGKTAALSPVTRRWNSPQLSALTEIPAYTRNFDSSFG